MARVVPLSVPDKAMAFKGYLRIRGGGGGDVFNYFLSLRRHLPSLPCPSDLNGAAIRSRVVQRRSMLQMCRALSRASAPGRTC